MLCVTNRHYTKTQKHHCDINGKHCFLKKLVKFQEVKYETISKCQRGTALCELIYRAGAKLFTQ